MVNNDEETGLISYIGKKHTVIKYDQMLYQWNMSVANNPDIHGVSYSEVTSLVIGKYVWLISGDYACSSKSREVELALRAAVSPEPWRPPSQCTPSGAGRVPLWSLWKAQRSGPGERSGCAAGQWYA